MNKAQRQALAEAKLAKLEEVGGADAIDIFRHYCDLVRQANPTPPRHEHDSSMRLISTCDICRKTDQTEAARRAAEEYFAEYPKQIRAAQEAAWAGAITCPV
jgi:hypothetical protein